MGHHNSLKIITIGAATLLSTFLHAEQQKISLLPTIKAPLLLPINGIANAQYWVTNFTQTTSTLALVPINGVSQDIAGIGTCGNPFTLAEGESCLLNLRIKGNKIGTKFSRGPLICTIKPSDNTSSASRTCAQPTLEDRLNITIVNAEKAVISVSTPTLVLNAGSTSSPLTITNNSPSVVANNIKAVLPQNWSDVSLNARHCIHLKPGHICNLLFTPGNNKYPPEIISIIGDNTTKVTSTIMVAAPQVQKIVK